MGSPARMSPLKEGSWGAPAELAEPVDRMDEDSSNNKNNNIINTNNDNDNKKDNDNSGVDKDQSPVTLFVGRLSRDAGDKDLEDTFYKFGKLSRCEVKRGKGYGFVEYEDRQVAFDVAKETDLQVLGEKVVVEVAGRKKTDEECFRCGKPGHWARDCPSGGGRSGRDRRSPYRGRRSRSPPRYRSGRNDDRDYRRRSRSPPRYRSGRYDGRDDRRDRRRDGSRDRRGGY